MRQVESESPEMRPGQEGQAGPPEVAAKDAHGQAAEWVENLTRDFQDKLTCGLYETLYSLDDSSVNTLMEGQARSCVTAFTGLTGLSGPMDLDSFLEAMRTTGPSQVNIEREGDVIHWTELHRGQCICPFVTRRVIRLDAKLCICGANWVKQLFEEVANTLVEVETLETVATGAENCCFRITVKGEAMQGGAA